MQSINLFSVKSLFVELLFDGTIVASGTGFVVDAPLGPLLITARHNVTGKHHQTNKLLSSTGGVPNQIAILQANVSKDATEISWVRSIAQLLDQDGNPLWYEHPVLGDKVDLVAIPLPTVDGIRPYKYSLDGKGEVQFNVDPATPVNVVGFPRGLGASGEMRPGLPPIAVWISGFVATEINFDFDGMPMFLINCRTTNGLSGAPVIAYRHPGYPIQIGKNVETRTSACFRFLGIYTGRDTKDGDIGYVWKTSVIRELAASVSAS
ncbi:MAG: serine protease [Gammaproteobacteria bacterium]|nr:serine protease [Gammaproteobacteria bacterium]